MKKNFIIDGIILIFLALILFFIALSSSEYFIFNIILGVLVGFMGILIVFSERTLLMNRTSLFPALAFGGSALAYSFRLLQNRTGFEPSGLPVSGSPWAILLPVVLALVLAASLILAGRIPSPKGNISCFEDAFSSFRTGPLTLLTAGIFLLAISGGLQMAANLGLLPDVTVLTASGLSRRTLSTGRGGLLEALSTLLSASCLFPPAAAPAAARRAAQAFPQPG